MENQDRQQQILNYLSYNHFASVYEISNAIYVSPATVRRDLKKLEQKGFVKIVYGGVVLSEYSNEVVPVSMRDKENSSLKEEIAQKAARLIHDNETVIFDASSTVRRICRHITHRKNLTIITNNLRICEELKDSEITVYCTGGALIRKRECFLGHYSQEFMRQITASACFFSSQGVLENGDIVDSSEEETALRKVMLQRARQKIFLCDSSKFKREYPFTLCNCADVTQIISDKTLPIIK